jgi:multicomponent Na+:H+ antiporter subunit F
VNWWLAGAAVLAAGIGPCLWVCLREQAASSLVAVELAGSLTTGALMLMAEGYGRSIYWDVALSVAVAQFVGGLVFARSVERRLWH